MWAQAIALGRLQDALPAQQGGGGDADSTDAVRVRADHPPSSPTTIPQRTWDSLSAFQQTLALAAGYAPPRESGAASLGGEDPE